MARQIRIDALASECGVAPREVLRVLIELGQFRYTRFNQQLAEDLAQQVRDALGPAAPEPAASSSTGGGIDLFAQAMSAAGVKPLDRRSGKSASAAKRTSKKKAHARARGSKARAVQAPPPAAKPAPPPEPAPEPPTEPALEPAVRSEPAAKASPPTAPPAPSEDGQAAALADLHLQLEQLQREHGALLTEHHQALAREAALEVRTGELRALSERLSEAPEGAVGAGLLDLLQARGLRGLDEAGFALRALLAAHLLDSSLPFLRSLDAERLQRILGERLCLCCGRPECGRPEGAEVVKVPLERCELCGGRELPRAHQAFSDACLLTGINRVLLVGGRRWHHAWHEAGRDRRVQARLWAGSQPLVERTLAEDLTWAQVVLVWDDGALSEGLAAAVQRRERGVLRLAAGSVGEMLGQAVSGIEGLDPAELA